MSATLIRTRIRRVGRVLTWLNPDPISHSGPTGDSAAIRSAEAPLAAGGGVRRGWVGGWLLAGRVAGCGGRGERVHPSKRRRGEGPSVQATSGRRCGPAEADGRVGGWATTRPAPPLFSRQPPWVYRAGLRGRRRVCPPRACSRFGGWGLGREVVAAVVVGGRGGGGWAGRGGMCGWCGPPIPIVLHAEPASLAARRRPRVPSAAAALGARAAAASRRCGQGWRRKAARALRCARPGGGGSPGSAIRVRISLNRHPKDPQVTVR